MENILLEYAIPILKVNRYFIPMKANLTEQYYNALKTLSCKIVTKEEFILPIEESKRTILLIKKEKATKKLFPRNNSQINKKPL